MAIHAAHARRQPLELHDPRRSTSCGPAPIGFRLKLVDRLIDDGFDAVLGDARLTRRHWQVLNLLQTELATLQRIDTLAGTVPSRFRGDDPPGPG
jgi:hypothetical protein